MKPTSLMIFIGLALLCLAATSCAHNKGVFVIINNANEGIKRVTVSVCEQTIHLKDIQPKERASGFFTVKSDSHYAVTVEFESGRILEKDIGYVTNGLNFHDEIVATDKDMWIVNGTS